jgi:hypothetical protein
VKQSHSILKEDVKPEEIKSSNLTTDCYYIYREDGKIDLGRGGMVAIFDDYYDKKIKLSRIELAGGNRNPKNSEPEI